ncbi:MAG: hypothetical protein E1N59_1174 [Puniceicoccaceae bacterium 5H]|nr:MAG: hypothetical protein E1N59_1174 [Puniceicoccaceae bacterium 5H]
MDWFRVLALLIALYVCLNLAAIWFAPKLIFPAPEPSYALADAPFQRLEYADGQHFLLTLQAPTQGEAIRPVPGAEGRVILYLHGNAADLGHVQSRIDALKQYGFTVCAPEYPGYGLSDGRPTEAGVFAVADQTYRFLRQQGYEPEQIVIWGRSLGSGPASYLASRQKCDRLILETPFASTFRVKTRIRLFFGDMFDNLGRAADITCPTLVLHGTDDEIVPYGQARKLAERLGGPVETYWVEGAGHNDLPDVAGALYWETTLGFAAGHPDAPIPVAQADALPTIED